MRAESFLLELGDGPQWFDRGACTDGSLFLGATPSDQVAICQRRPVRECLSYAVENDERFGVGWPGLRPVACSSARGSLSRPQRFRPHSRRHMCVDM